MNKNQIPNMKCSNRYIQLFNKDNNDLPTVATNEMKNTAKQN